MVCGGAGGRGSGDVLVELRQRMVGWSDCAEMILARLAPLRRVEGWGQRAFQVRRGSWVQWHLPGAGGGAV